MDLTWYSFLAYFSAATTDMLEAEMRKQHLGRWSSGVFAPNGDMLMIATRTNVKGSSRAKEIPNCRIKGGYTVVRLSNDGTVKDLGFTCDTPNEATDILTTVLEMEQKSCAD